jgi:antibiotic biosynthesis monooxygenase (ABM) superfamily enzyme
VTPPRHRLAAATWLAIYPTITLVLPGLEAFGVNDLALPLRTLAISLVVVPVVVFVVTPALTRLLGGWLHGAPPRHAGRDFSRRRSTGSAAVQDSTYPPSKGSGPIVSAE